MGALGRIWLNDKAPAWPRAVVVQDFEALPGYSGQFCPELVSTAFRSRKEIAPVWIAHGQRAPVRGGIGEGRCYSACGAPLAGICDGMWRFEAEQQRGVGFECREWQRECEGGSVGLRAREDQKVSDCLAAS
jgi:hypothetical protein